MKRLLNINGFYNKVIIITEHKILKNNIHIINKMKI